MARRPGAPKKGATDRGRGQYPLSRDWREEGAAPKTLQRRRGPGPGTGTLTVAPGRRRSVGRGLRPTPLLSPRRCPRLRPPLPPFSRSGSGSPPSPRPPCFRLTDRARGPMGGTLGRRQRGLARGGAGRARHGGIVVRGVGRGRGGRDSGVGRGPLRESGPRAGTEGAGSTRDPPRPESPCSPPAAAPPGALPQTWTPEPRPQHTLVPALPCVPRRDTTETCMQRQACMVAHASHPRAREAEAGGSRGV